MRGVERRLACLNLAVLLMLLLAVPASAVEECGGDPSPAPGRMEERLESALEPRAAAGSYLIAVGGSFFYSDEDAYGTNWEYTAEDNSLFLNGYEGGGIIADGDLRISTSGYVRLTGGNGENYGGDGIMVRGDLQLWIYNGTVTISGGQGTVSGGNGIFTYGDLALYNWGSSMTITGGAGPAGGHGIISSNVFIAGNSCTLTGGTGMDGAGGCAILGAGNVDVYADCRLTGGNGSKNGGPAIVFTVACEFGVVNATVQGGRNSDYSCVMAIIGPSNQPWYYNQHTTVTGNSYSFRITPKQYTLHLLGGGGVLSNGATMTSLRDYYPTTYNLGADQFRFYRDGYSHVAWEDIYGNVCALNRHYTPATNTSLFAYWVSAGKGDILLNAVDAKFSDGGFYQKYSGKSVTLPGVNYQYDSFLAWCDQFNISEGTEQNRYLYSGNWYAENDTVTPDPNRATVLYAQRESGRFALYHANGGTARGGGTLLVQGTPSTLTDLKTYMPDGSDLAAPESIKLGNTALSGVKLIGWSTSKDSAVARYQPNDPIVLGDAVQEFYAVWGRAVEDGVFASTNAAGNILYITMSREWCEHYGVQRGYCAIYNGEKLVQCAAASYQAGKPLVLEVPYSEQAGLRCKVFAVDAQNAPVHGALQF